MQRMMLKGSGALAILLAGMLAGGSPALADKPDWAGGGKGDKHEQRFKERNGGHDRVERGGDARGSRDGGGIGVSIDLRFGDRQRIAVRDYFADQFRAGRCPPGLAKKGNGCMPPGQAKKWAVGRPLPRDVIFYELPPAVVVELGVPPAGYRYVRVAADILMIAVGTSMVVDAIEDLGRM